MFILPQESAVQPAAPGTVSVYAAGSRTVPAAAHGSSSILRTALVVQQMAHFLLFGFQIEQILWICLHLNRDTLQDFQAVFL